MNKRRVVLWGNLDDYFTFREAFLNGMRRSDVDVVAMICDKAEQITEMDGIKMIEIEELVEQEFDFLIDFHNEAVFEQVKGIVMLLNISTEKLIKGFIFYAPYFDFERYLAVRENYPSIITHHCFAGFLYHSLGLEFKTPFINLFIPEKKMIEKLYLHLEENMSITPRFMRMEHENRLNIDYPVLALGDIELHCNHYKSAEEAIEIWNRRKKRIDYNHILFEMTIENDEDYGFFQKLPEEKRLGFSAVPCADEDIIYIPNWKNFKQLSLAANCTINPEIKIARCLDGLKLLSGEKDFKKIKYERGFV